MIRRPPWSTLVTYTTRCRSRHRHTHRQAKAIIGPTPHSRGPGWNKEPPQTRLAPSVILFWSNRQRPGCSPLSVYLPKDLQKDISIQSLNSIWYKLWNDRCTIYIHIYIQTDSEHILGASVGLAQARPNYTCSATNQRAGTVVNSLRTHQQIG